MAKIITTYRQTNLLKFLKKSVGGSTFMHKCRGHFYIKKYVVAPTWNL